MNHQPSTNEDTEAVRIPRSLAQRIQRRLPGSDFSSIDAYVSYVLDQLITELEGGKQKSQEAFSEEEQKIVEDRLRNLGYM